MGACNEITSEEDSGVWPIYALAVAAGSVICLFVLIPAFRGGESTAIESFESLRKSFRAYRGGLGYFPLLAAIFFYWRARPELTLGGTEPSYRGLPLAAFGFLLFVASARLNSPFVALVSLSVLIVGLGWSICGSRMAKALLFPSLLLLFLLPFPGYFYAVAPLINQVAQLAHGIISICGVEAFRYGTFISSADHLWELEIGEGSSGGWISSPYYPCFFATAIIAHLLLGRLWQKFTLLSLVLPAILLFAAIRVASIILLAEWVNPKLAGSMYHVYSGWIFLSLSLGLLIAIALGLRWIGGGRSQRGS